MEGTMKATLRENERIMFTMQGCLLTKENSEYFNTSAQWRVYRSGIRVYTTRVDTDALTNFAAVVVLEKKRLDNGS
jgi:hypothetical protein